MSKQSKNSPQTVTVLGLVVCALVLVGVFTPMVLRHQPDPMKPGHARAVYVRDASHGCFLVIHVPAQKQWDYATEKEVPTEGGSLYHCDSGVWLDIEDNMEQP